MNIAEITGVEQGTARAHANGRVPAIEKKTSLGGLFLTRDSIITDDTEALSPTMKTKDIQRDSRAGSVPTSAVRRRYSVASTALLGLVFIQIAIAIGIAIGIDWVSAVSRCFFSHLAPSSAQPTQHRRQAVQFILSFLASGLVQRLSDNQYVLDRCAFQRRPPCDLEVAPAVRIGRLSVAMAMFNGIDGLARRHESRAARWTPSSHAAIS